MLAAVRWPVGALLLGAAGVALPMFVVVEKGYPFSASFTCSDG